MLSCKKATGLVEKRRHCHLETMEHLQLRAHLSMCGNCSRYAKQAGFIDRLLNRQSSSLVSTADTSMLEERIIKGIHSEPQP